MILKRLMLGLLVIFLLFVGWMNLTPGHFQGTCYCTVKYMTNEEAEKERLGICRVIGICRYTESSLPKTLFLILVSNLDFNK